MTRPGSARIGSAHSTVNYPSLRWKSAENADVGAWAALISRTAAVEKPVWFERRPELEQIMESRKNPPEANTVLGFGPDGVARAYARIIKNVDGGKAYGFGCVDPQWQRRGVGSALLEWLETRTRQRFLEDGSAPATARLRIHNEQQHEHQAALFTRHGYSVVRYFNEMHKPLTGPLPEVVVDQGFELVAMGPDLSEAVRLAHNEAFRDHWGSEPKDEESWRFIVNDPQARPDLSAVVLERATGKVAGYQLATYDPESAVTRGFSEGYTDLLGVRREFRGRGIASALLADAMRRFAAEGLDVASLDVDSENPTGALALYLKMGYKPVNRSLAWDKSLP
jgi:ribosomal protein S18 acetylase RimI-like enzyme